MMHFPPFPQTKKKNSTDLDSDRLRFLRKEDHRRHLPAHILLQIRQPFPQTGLSGLFEQAKQKSNVLILNNECL